MIRFKHIYIEEEAYNYSHCISILKKIPKAEPIQIGNYKHIFNRPNQNFQEQKESMKLILAVKKDNFLYQGSEVVNNYGFEKFYYNTLILNCVYNCEYCYLQGMFNSGNVVVFVNLEEFFLETEKILADNSLYLCISYETDILAFEDLIPYTSAWIEFARTHPNLTIEVRTKSNQYKRIQHLTPAKNVILAWTISPEEVTAKYEHKTATLNRRLEDIQKATNDGWNVRICFDPILHIKDWKEIYEGLIETTFKKIDSDKVFDISLGTFRINADYLKKIKKMQTSSDILYYPFNRVGKLNTYSEKKVAEIFEFMISKIGKYYEKTKVFPTF